MGYFNAAFFSGFGFGPLLGGTLTEHLGITSAFATMGALSFLAFLGVIFFLPEVSPRKLVTSSNHSLEKMRTSDVIKGLFSYRLSFALGRGAFATFLPIFAAIIGLSVTHIGILLSVSILTVSILGPLGGMIADRFNRRVLVVLGKSIFIISMVVIPMTNSFEQLLGALLIQGISGAICMPAASALIVGEGRRFGMGSTMSTFFLAMGIGTATGPVLSGVIADSMSINSVFYNAAGMGVIGTSLFIWFSR